jgi:NAD(P)H-hydrate repair Nnr-like enzyme with NAD(P)H-hydrate epimerase domain
VLGTAHSDAAGDFTFSFVTRSAYWAQLPAQANSSYIVAVDPPSGLTAERALVQNVVVTAGHETGLGTIDLP